MKRLAPRLFLVVLFSASAAMVEAQAVARGGGGGGSSSSSGSSSSGSSSSGSSGGGGGSTSSSSSGGGSTYSAPAPQHSAPPRTPSSHSGGSSGSSASRGGSSAGSGSNAGTAAVRHPNGSASGATNATAPAYARPDGRPYAGYAVPRVRGAYHPPNYYYSPIYINPWGFGPFGYGYGLGYLYDPFYGGGYGWPGYGGYGYGYGGGYGGGYGYPGSGYYDSNSTPSDEQPEAAQDAPDGQLRIKVKPREAKVMVDGSFVGTVDDFDGVFQKLSLPEGRHHVALQLDGYLPLSFDVMIVAGQTINYQGEMHKR